MAATKDDLTMIGGDDLGGGNVSGFAGDVAGLDANSTSFLEGL